MKTAADMRKLADELMRPRFDEGRVSALVDAWLGHIEGAVRKNPCAACLGTSLLPTLRNGSTTADHDEAKERMRAAGFAFGDGFVRWGLTADVSEGACGR